MRPDGRLARGLGSARSDGRPLRDPRGRSSGLHAQGTVSCDHAAARGRARSANDPRRACLIHRAEPTGRALRVWVRQARCGPGARTAEWRRSVGDRGAHAGNPRFAECAPLLSAPAGGGPADHAHRQPRRLRHPQRLRSRLPPRRRRLPRPLLQRLSTTRPRIHLSPRLRTPVPPPTDQPAPQHTSRVDAPPTAECRYAMRTLVSPSTVRNAPRDFARCCHRRRFRARRYADHALVPPSTVKIAPVTLRPLSPARNATIAAMSAGSAKRPSADSWTCWS